MLLAAGGFFENVIQSWPNLAKRYLIFIIVHFRKHFFQFAFTTYKVCFFIKFDVSDVASSSNEYSISKNKTACLQTVNNLRVNISAWQTSE